MSQISRIAVNKSFLKYLRGFKLDRVWVCGTCLLGIVLLGVLAPYISHIEPTTVNLLARNEPPIWYEGGSWYHPLGTDNLGRDMLSRCLHGIRTSFGIATLGLIFSAILGIAIGIVSGLRGGYADQFLMFITDVFITIPNLLLLLAGIVLLGTEIWVLIVMIGLIRWEAYARIVRGQVMALRELGFIEASYVLGASQLRIALGHVIPNLISPLTVILTLSFPSVLLMEAGLSFLGVGVQPPTPSLGRMIGSGRDYLLDAWWISGMPSIVIVTITMLFQLIGDALRDKLDVRLDG